MTLRINTGRDPDQCVVCLGEMFVVRATTETEEAGWVCKCQSCGVEQVLYDEEIVAAMKDWTAYEFDDEGFGTVLDAEADTETAAYVYRNDDGDWVKEDA